MNSILESILESVLESVLEIGKSIIPVRTEAMWGATVGVMGTIFTFCFGEWSNALQSLTVFIFIDYVTGVMAAYMQPRAELCSEKGLRGLVKKLALMTFVAFAHWLDIAVGQTVFATIVIYTLLGTEGLSITENLGRCGVPIPDGIKNKLKQLAHEKDKQVKGGL